jgi:tRNA threonylcarbamoyladenosine biosynthesis protein TsaE
MIKVFRLKIPSVHDLDDAALKMLKAYPDKRVFAFYGDMGAGKTTFIKALCRAINVEDITSSPSFGLVHEYSAGGKDSVYHFDLFRIKTAEEVFDIGYEDYIYSGNYCFLEWPEIIESWLPESAVRISLKVSDDGTRVLNEIPPSD